MQYSTSLQPNLTRYAWLSIGAAIFTIALKTVAYLLTNSVGLFSDALESCINLAGAVMALSMLIIASRPADNDHTYGHYKAEYFSSGVEGILIFFAALGIGYVAVKRIINPQPIEQLGIGIIVSIIASLVNLFVALILLKASKRHHSITLEADGKHLMTDVWTSVGVLIGIGAVALTGWQILDPIVALIVAGNIIWTGYIIVKNSVAGLMDKALPIETQEKIRNTLQPYKDSGIQFHAFLSRQAGMRQFISFHVLVPGDWSVLKGHDLLERIEEDIKNILPNIFVSTHLEPIEDPSSYKDIAP